MVRKTKKMIRILLIIFYFIRIKKKVKLSEIKFILDEDTLQKKSNIKLSDINDWSEEQLELKDTILKGGYIDGLGGYPLITKDNICLDGHHRIVLLKNYKEEDYEITVNKLFMFKWNFLHKYYKIRLKSGKSLNCSKK